MTVFILIHDGECLWLEQGVQNMHTEIRSADFPCAGDERHAATLVRGGEEIAQYVQHEDDWAYWVDEDGDSCESLFADFFNVGDKLIVEVS